MDIKKTKYFRFIPATGVLLLALTASGCLGVFQEISAAPNGKTVTQVRFSMSKALVTALDSMGGEPTDTDDIFDMEDSPIKPESIPGLTDVVVEQLNNDVDVGIRFTGTYTGIPAGIGPETAPFVPFYLGSTMVIGLPPMGEDDQESAGSEADAMSAMFFASTKYQLVLDKELYPEIGSAHVMAGEERHPASVTELAGGWLVEFPFVTWIQAAGGCRVVVELLDS